MGGLLIFLFCFFSALLINKVTTVPSSGKREAISIPTLNPICSDVSEPANDANKPIRKSHENPAIKQVYAEFFEKPGSHKAHEILHTAYVARDKF